MFGHMQRLAYVTTRCNSPHVIIRPVSLNKAERDQADRACKFKHIHKSDKHLGIVLYMINEKEVGAQVQVQCEMTSGTL